MSDLGLYHVLQKKITHAFPALPIFGHPLSEYAPPCIRIQVNSLEKASLPQKAARIKTVFHIMSRYKGEAEIQDLQEKVLHCLEGERLGLQEDAVGLVKFEESQLKMEKDGVTRTALLLFTILIKLK